MNIRAIDSLPTPARATAEVPLLSGVRLDMVRAFQGGASYFCISRRFGDLAAEIEASSKDSKVSLPRTRGVLAKAAQPGSLPLHTLHAIPRDVLGSLLLGSVASDGPDGYEGDIPGVYVVGIDAKNGGYLTGNEQDDLCRHLYDYIQGYKAYEEHGGNPRNQVETQLAAFVRSVDDTFARPAGSLPKPRFCSSKRTCGMLERFLEGARRRRDAAWLLEPTGKTRCLQGPLYVGCSAKVVTRTRVYDPNPTTPLLSTFTGCNKPYALCMSILRLMGMQPRPRIVTAVRVWENDQLEMTELLVAALARGYATLDGLSTCEAGGQPSPHLSAVKIKNYKFDVLGLYPWALKNFESSYRAIQARQKFVDDFLSLGAFCNPPSGRRTTADQDALESVAREGQLLVQARASCADMLRRLNEEVAREEERLAALKTRHQLLQDAVELFAILTENLRKAKARAAAEQAVKQEEAESHEQGREPTDEWGEGQPPEEAVEKMETESE